ncbi:hypothetical protein [Patulibacter minatonensis]|uniref:hypothetical protein n=1 Tax=Patulibacter minatonensis TaxID=298163 RepID=UPI0006840097|nr:hypothetical protein [Patulibacter minatonensis]
MTHENVVSIRLEDPARATAVVDALRDASRMDKLVLNALVTVEVAADGTVAVGELREAAGDGMRHTGTLGGLVGILGGPLGAVVGWGVGTRLGERFDAEEASEDEDAIVAAVHDLPPGSVAVVAEVEEEPDNEHRLDELVADLGGRVLRRRTEALLEELEASVARGEVPARPGDRPPSSRGARIAALRERLEG